MKELKWGIIGCGNISHDFAVAMGQCKNPHKITAVGARSLSAASEFCKANGLTDPKAYGSYEELLKDDNVDVVYIGLLNDLHKKWTLIALDAGKHVLCEKPLAVNYAEVKQMTSKAKEKNLFLMEAFWSRCFPIWHKVREILDSGEMGELRTVHANIGVGQMPDSCHSTEHGSTPLLAIGVYPLLFALWAFPGQRPTIDVKGYVNDQGSDIWANITLRYEKGRHACLYYNSTTYTPNSAYVGLEKGLLHIPDFLFAPTQLIQTRSTASGVDKETFDFPLKDDASKYVYPNSSGLHYEADHVYECVVKRGLKQSDLISLKESELMAQILDEIRLQIGVKYPQDLKQ
jgi:dihydrodiol dehydrogenase / D-xylose 1-dehydrogenase (NADP)